MVLLNWLMDGLVFVSGDFFLYQGAFTRVPQRPLICDKCDSHSGCFHAHGRYKRSLTSFKKHQLKQIKVWMQRADDEQWAFGCYTVYAQLHTGYCRGVMGIFAW
jgi:hypothetical protein